VGNIKTTTYGAIQVSLFAIFALGVFPETSGLMELSINGAFIAELTSTARSTIIFMASGTIRILIRDHVGDFLL
jgi:hypothetical protein